MAKPTEPTPTERLGQIAIERWQVDNRIRALEAAKQQRIAALDRRIAEERNTLTLLDRELEQILAGMPPAQPTEG